MSNEVVNFAQQRVMEWQENDTEILNKSFGTHNSF